VGSVARWLTRRTLLWDVLLAGALSLVAFSSVTDAALGDRHRLAVALALCQTLPLVARRRLPVLVLAATSGALAGVLGPALAAYAVAAHGVRPVGPALAGAGALAALGAPFLDDGSTTTGDFFAVLAAYAIPWFVGSRVRRTRLRTVELERRAAEAESAREEEARRAVAEERGRLARELHDIVSHAVSVTIVQAAAAKRALRSSPERAAEHVGTIESAGREAMRELRLLLDVLRDDGSEAGALAPQPGVADLDALAERMRAAGLPVDLTVEGEPRTLPASLDLTAYRVVQEALTNALRYAGAARTAVVLRYSPDTIEIAVLDEGRGPAAGAAGRGLSGMRERVTLLGGALTAAGRPEGGFEVRATLPLGETGV
jgi:signal transduction histidine kinase